MVPINKSVIKQVSYFTLTLTLTILSGCSTVPLSSPTEERNPEPGMNQPAETTNEYILKTEPTLSSKQTQVKPTLPEKTRIKQAVPVPKVNTTSVQPSNGAVIALLKNADTQRQQGDLYSAQNNIQRAQRISPNDPHVYYALALIHKDLNDFDLAEQVALKGISIVQHKPKELKRFWLLLSDIYNSSGNKVAAKKALNQANLL